jgi:diaminopimelate epimerase
MKKISFAKMSGAGNDFVLFDRRANSGLELTPQRVKNICHRRKGIGADGVLVIDDKPGYDFNMEYYNSDGSTGTLCGNGARCIIRYAYLSGRLKDGKATFMCYDKIYTGEIIDPDNVKFYFNSPLAIETNFLINVDNNMLNVSYADTGSPHVVIKSTEIYKLPGTVDSRGNSFDQLPVFELGRKIRYLENFAPRGANVNFIENTEGKLKIRTYERGVEDETLACGTGSVASALIAFLVDNINPPVKLITKGGYELIVDFKYSDGKFEDLSLTGHSEVVFTGEFYSNLF